MAEVSKRIHGISTHQSRPKQHLNHVEGGCGEGMADMVPDNIEEHITGHAQALTNKELEDLTRSSTEDEDDENREVDNEEEPAAWTLEKFS